MHADVALEIAYSGEFFVRRVHASKPSPEKQPAAEEHADGAHPNGDSAPVQNSKADEEEPDVDVDHFDPASLPPSAYELVIDNASGTYRPSKDLLPTLAAYLSRPENLGALGRVRAIDGFDEKLVKWKEQRTEVRKRAVGGKGKETKGMVRQASFSSSSSSSSSSSEGDREAAEGARQDAEAERQKGARGQAEKAEKEDAKRAKENDDDDQAAQEEKRDVKDGEA